MQTEFIILDELESMIEKCADSAEYVRCCAALYEQQYGTSSGSKPVSDPFCSPGVLYTDHGHQLFKFDRQ